MLTYLVPLTLGILGLSLLFPSRALTIIAGALLIVTAFFYLK